MAMLAALNVLLVGVWVGMYLFTTFVVSPAFRVIFADPAERQRHRQTVGRVYSRVNAPLSAALLLMALVQGFSRGWTGALLAEVLLLVSIGGLVAWHIRRAGGADLPPAWLSPATLLASFLLCGAAVMAGSKS